MIEQRIAEHFPNVIPTGVDFCSLRYQRDVSDHVSVRKGVLLPIEQSVDDGVMITVYARGGIGYAATTDTTLSGLKAAAEVAKAWALKTSGRTVYDFSKLDLKTPSGRYASPVRVPWHSIPLTEKVERLKALCSKLEHPKVVENFAEWRSGSSRRLLLTSANGNQGRVDQETTFLIPRMHVVASDKGVTQTRSFGSRGSVRQGGFELLESTDYDKGAAQILEEALQLVAAPNCPKDTRDLVIDPDQMTLQIHESIGHPLELDRILGDERNYAGTSFVTKDMFGTYQYGSKHLNITFDPTVRDQIASYAFDDDGTKAEKQYLIKEGVLIRPLGGAISQQRAGLEGVANSRSSAWNRPAIDRMANLNLEPGTSRFEDMIASVEKGVYVKTNCSWSIDDSRNKFQFGCEWAQLIENGKLTSVVRNPNYRGISASFWRNLHMVGGMDTFSILGTPHCGKGEPNQLVAVGHATPTCLFRNVEVFGGE